MREREAVGHTSQLPITESPVLRKLIPINGESICGRPRERLTAQAPVLRFYKRGSNADLHRRGVDTHQLEIEERMDIGPEQKPVGGDVRLTTHVRVDMSCFEDIDHSTAGYGALVLVGPQKQAPKISLALALYNRRKNAVSLIFDSLRKEEARVIDKLALQLKSGQRIARNSSGRSDLEELDQCPSDLWTDILRRPESIKPILV